MNELLKVFLSLSLSGTLLIIVLLALKPLLKHIFSKQWQYYIWLIVILRLLLPFSPETSLVGNIAQHIEQASIRTEVNQQLEPNRNILPQTDGDSTQIFDHRTAHVRDGEASKLEEKPLQSMLLTAMQNIGTIWLMVAISLAIRKITIYHSFVKYIKAGRMEISDLELWERFGKLVEQSGVKSTVEIYTNSLISSPLLIGFFRPCILLPTTKISPSDVQYTILHELTHYKRRDMLYKWLVQMTICLHWFNPLVYLMGREVNRLCELACDEAVIQKLDVNYRRGYGDTLLNALARGGNDGDAFVSVTLCQNKELMKERLDAIMNYKKKSGIVRMISVLLTAVLFCGATFTGAYAVNHTTKPFTTSVDEKVDYWTNNTNRKDQRLNVSFPYRLTLQELPSDLQLWIKDCDQSKGIFVIQYMSRYYVYCNLISNNYSWQPAEGRLDLFDRDDELVGYALISLPLYDELTVTYKDDLISVTKDKVQVINPSSSRMTPSGDDASTVYKIASGKIIVPFSIENIPEDINGDHEGYGYVCLGQIPNIKNIKRITYSIEADSGTGLFVAMSTSDKKLSNRYDWYNFCVTPDRKIDRILETAKGRIGWDNLYSGNYFLYVGTTEAVLTDITGTITIEY